MFVLCRKCVLRRRRREEWYNRPWSGRWKKTRWNVPQNISGCHDDHMQCIGTHPACFSFGIHKYLYYRTTYGFLIHCAVTWKEGRIELSCSRMFVSWINTRHVCRLSRSKLQCVSEICKGFILTESDYVCIYNWNIILGPRFQINSCLLVSCVSSSKHYRQAGCVVKYQNLVRVANLKFLLQPSFS